jgi:hypothetical protein
MHLSPEIFKLRRLTGKRLEICYLCFRKSNGNFDKALEYCSDSNSEEDGR